MPRALDAPSVSPDPDAAVARLIASRAEQGYGPTVTDPAVVARVATFLRPAPSRDARAAS